MNKLMLLSSLVCVSVYGAEGRQVKSSSEMKRERDIIQNAFTNALSILDKQRECRICEERLSGGDLDESDKKGLEEKILQEKIVILNLQEQFPYCHVQIINNEEKFDVSFRHLPRTENVVTRLLQVLTRIINEHNQSSIRMAHERNQ